ncbi:MAG: hypothetical protein WA990_01950 [Rubrobacteraceae bacterium]
MCQTQVSRELPCGGIHPALLQDAEPDDYGDGYEDAQDGDGDEEFGQGEASLVLVGTGYPRPNCVHVFVFGTITVSL